MNTLSKLISPRATLSRALALAALLCVCLVPAQAQTAGGTQIQNRASATYSDGTNNYSTVSNTVTVTVANVSGLAITPDAGTNPSVVAGQSNVDFTFTVTNTSNFSTQVRFLASGASVVLTGPATVSAAVIDVNGNGIDGADTDILGNGADVLSAALARNTSLTVIVRANINSGAASGSNISVRLGDSASGGPSFDNQTANNSANEVRTSVPSATTAPVNGESEARGDITATVDADTQLRLNINYPAGPVSLGSAITYTFSLDNTGQRPANAQTLAGAPAGSNSGVFVVAPIPVGTSFTSITPPAGVTVLYSTSSLANDPLAASTVWTTTPPAPGTATRVAFNVGNSLAAGASVSNLQMSVTVSTTVNASNPIWQIADAFAQNNVSSPVTDQSGDNISNRGDGNANFNEPKLGVDSATPTQGFQVPTLLTLVGNVLIGPANFPDAVGPTSINDDYTNRASNAGIAGIAFGGNTTAGSVTDFTNTVRNTGNGNDTFNLTAPTVPAGFTVAISTTGAGGPFTVVSGGGSTTLALNFGQQADIVVRVTAPSGIAVLTGHEVVIRATSQSTNTNSNDTIDRLYTGFLRLTKSYQVFNTTGVGGASDAVPGAEIEYTISYQNVSTSGGTNNVTLTASSVVITEDGNLAPNNWGTTTTQVVGSASDSGGGTITGDTAGSNVLTDSIATLPPGPARTFKFRRRIN
ncbi:MAG TPA: hypothetical protein VGV38_01705 [Pyrinomonadaceae bacterium]|nr:hypothetical protein [Pyrinomonadaceae bacterium]